MWNLKYDTNELIYKTETDSQLIPPLPFPLVAINLFSTSVTLFLFCK